MFQSTPSARRATEITNQGAGWAIVSIHALRTEGDSGTLYDSGVSIHALRTGDEQPGVHDGSGDVSIHALRTEGDEHE